MYFECETWMGEHFLTKVNILKGIILVLGQKMNCDSLLIKYKRIPKKDIIFE